MKIVTETILYEYFLHNAVWGNVEEKLCEELCLLFALNSAERQAFNVAKSCGAAKNIVTENDYKVYTRSKQYAILTKRPIGYSTEDDEIVSIKGRAIKEASKAGLFRTQNDTPLYVLQRLTVSAESGNIIALRILGIASAIGLLQAEINGMDCLEKVARWGNPIGAMAFLRYTYDPNKDMTDVISILNAAVSGTLYEAFGKRLGKIYEADIIEENVGVRLLRQSFAEEKTDPGYYDPLRAKIAYSTVLGLKDKQYLMAMKDEDLYVMAGKLPFSLPMNDLSFAKFDFKDFILQRKNELYEISAWLDSADLRSSDKYRPLCLVTDNDFVSELYRTELIRVICGNVETIEVADLNDYDFEPSDNNVFLRHLSEETDNMLIFHLKGSIDETHLEHICDFLKSGQRRKFHLNKPSVTLDLGNVLPICICDKENAIKIRDFVEEVSIASVTEEEKPIILRDIVKRKAELYCVKGDIGEEGINVLSSAPLDIAERVIDKAVRASRSEGEDFVLTAETLSPYMIGKYNANKSYGFGGNI